MNPKLAQVKSITNISGYYNQLSALELKEGQEVAPESPPDATGSNLLLSPFLLHGVVILFFLLFLGGLAVQIFHRAFSMRRTLTVMSVALIISSIPLSLKLLTQQTTLQIKASPDTVPHNVELTQSGPSSLTVTWVTVAQVVGSVRYGTSIQNTKLAVSNGARPTQTHTVELTNLTPNISYELEIVSGTYTYHLDGRPLTFQLAPL